VPVPVKWYVYGKMEPIAALGTTDPVAFATARDGEEVNGGDIEIHPSPRVRGKVKLERLTGIADGMPPELRAGAATVVWSNSGDAGGFSVGPDELPDHRLAQGGAQNITAALTERNTGPSAIPAAAAHTSIAILTQVGIGWSASGRACRSDPRCISGLPLLDMLEGKRRHFGAPQPAAEQDGEDGPVAQTLVGGGIRCIQERLSLLRCEPVSRDGRPWRRLPSLA
jgi:hypothetical protein